MANTLSYTFSSDLPGEYKLVLEASNKGCTGRKEAIVTVIDRGAPPAVSGIEEEYTIDADADLQLSPTVVSDNEVTYAWFMDEEEVANGAGYTFNALRPGSYEIISLTWEEPRRRKFPSRLKPKSYGSKRLHIRSYRLKHPPI